jgi:hypothetical protein
MSALHDMLIDRHWERTNRADEIRKLITESGVDNLLPNEETDLKAFLSSLPGTYEVPNKGTTWEEWLQREGYTEPQMLGIHEHYLRTKLEDRGYPGLRPTEEVMSDVIQSNPGVPLYPSTSQADEIMKKASEPGMYPVTQYPRACTEPVVWVERLADHIVELRFENIPEHSIQIVQDILPKAIELYLRKSKDYGGLSGGLGPRAPFVDMWRKILKLKRCMWEGEELKFEQTDEIIMDLIGTCLNILGEMK